jgi:hypothetical protein
LGAKIDEHGRLADFPAAGYLVNKIRAACGADVARMTTRFFGSP